MYGIIRDRCSALIKNFAEIPEDRRLLLDKLSVHINQKLNNGIPVQLVYICTHNSRRSHLGQVWGLGASRYFGIKNIETFSAGTKTTAFNRNAIKALETSGFKVQQMDDSSNSNYKVYFDEIYHCNCFSKTLDDISLPESNFVAVMTCSEANENCPYIAGCDLRIGATYFDPKSYDNTVLQDEKYLERNNQIAMENLYVFSRIKISDQ